MNTALGLSLWSDRAREEVLEVSMDGDHLASVGEQPGLLEHERQRHVLQQQQQALLTTEWIGEPS